MTKLAPESNFSLTSLYQTSQEISTGSEVARRGPQIETGGGLYLVRPSPVFDKGNTSELLTASDIYHESTNESDIFKAHLVIRRARTFLEVSLPLSYAESALDRMRADDQIQGFSNEMRRLSSLRSIGDGFLMIVHSVINGIENRQGLPLSQEQIRNVDKSLKLIYEKPRLTFEDALLAVEDLETNGFSTDPEGVSQLTEWIDTVSDV